MRLCSVIECIEPAGAKTGDRCEAHAKRAQRGQPLTPPLARRPAARDNPLAVLMEAALRFANASAEDDADYDKAVDNLRQAAKRYQRPRR